MNEAGGGRTECIYQLPDGQEFFSAQELAAICGASVSAIYKRRDQLRRRDLSFPFKPDFPLERPSAEYLLSFHAKQTRAARFDKLRDKNCGRIVESVSA